MNENLKLKEQPVKEDLLIPSNLSWVIPMINHISEYNEKDSVFFYNYLLTSDIGSLITIARYGDIIIKFKFSNYSGETEKENQNLNIIIENKLKSTPLFTIKRSNISLALFKTNMKLIIDFLRGPLQTI